MIRSHFLDLRVDIMRFALGTHNNAVLGPFEVFQCHFFRTVPSRLDSRLIDHVLQVSTRETGCAACEDHRINIWRRGMLS